MNPLFDADEYTLKRIRRSRIALPLDFRGGSVLEAFREAKRCYPIEARGFNERTHREEVRRVSLGSNAKAQQYWDLILRTGEATAQELYTCAWIARKRWELERYLWVPNFDTFYGPEKSHWANFLEDARALLAREGGA